MLDSPSDTPGLPATEGSEQGRPQRPGQPHAVWYAHQVAIGTSGGFVYPQGWLLLSSTPPQGRCDGVAKGLYLHGARLECQVGAGRLYGELGEEEQTKLKDFSDAMLSDWCRDTWEGCRPTTTPTPSYMATPTATITSIPIPLSSALVRDLAQFLSCNCSHCNPHI